MITKYLPNRHAIVMTLMLFFLAPCPPCAVAGVPVKIRVATYNVALNRKKAGELIDDLKTSNHPQIRAVAEIIQRVHPDVLLLNEFDFDAKGPGGTSLAARLFQKNYLAIGKNGAKPVHYPYVYCAPSNTGVPSGFDLNNNGRTNDPDDALGFGRFEGQYGMLILSKYPIAKDKVRTFRKFLWKDMPGALLPDDAATPEKKDWYSFEELDVVRLSSKSHWDVPVDVAGETIHILASHPVPPVFDGPEDRNGKRNHDEIRFWSDYITPTKGSYIYDDLKKRGGLEADAHFIIMGDLNADPNDSDSTRTQNAIKLLLRSPNINTTLTPSSEGALEAGKLQGGVNLKQISNPRYDTSDWEDAMGCSGNLRADYILPSKNLKILQAKVFWPPSADPLYRLVGDGVNIVSSDHRMAWIDIEPERRPDSVSKHAGNVHK